MGMRHTVWADRIEVAIEAALDHHSQSATFDTIAQN